ncbi:S-layer homology domain-containing protein [Ureibacillus sinduriensis]|uniref:S-layer homology domain-containing protein n=1 Tax=Ureibacillus sinduriensis TaxID=561440 RepID=UPI00068CB4F8|nr:S-layer homology domain-containing protein [Ureibacillus sinduriensis]
MNRKSTYCKSLAGALALSVSMPAIVIPVEAQTVETANDTLFSDVTPKHWAYSSIMKASQQGLVEGYNGKFNPNGKVTRAEFATFLSRVFDGGKGLQNTFSDVPSTHWATDAINEGIALGFIKPNDYNNNKFSPDQTMTRNEIVKWLVNGLVSQNPIYSTILEELDSDLTLLPVTEFYKGGLDKEDIPYFGVALGTGLITGYADFSIRPNGNTSRSEVVVMLFRIQDILSKDPNMFSDLNELREVAITGTNILSLTKYEKKRHSNDNDFWYRVTEDAAKKENLTLEEYVKKYFGEAFKLPVAGEEFGGFEDVLGKPYTLHNNRAVNTIERAIFVDTTGPQAKGIYKDMFFDNEPIALNRNYYAIYYEYTTTPSKDSTLFSLGNGSISWQVGNDTVNSAKAKQFGITTPPTLTGWYYEEGEDGVFNKIIDNFFTKGKTVRYWAVKSAGGKAVDDPFSDYDQIRGRTDNGSQFYYEILK